MQEQPPGTEPEYLLWKTVVNDDEKAFQKLFELFYPALCIYAKKYIEERSIREDIVQDMFVYLWEDRKKLSITTSLRNYLMVAVRNRCFNYLHKEGIIRQYQESISSDYAEPQDEEMYLLSELYDLLDKTLAKLPETYRLVFEMHRMQGKDYNEIAETLNISVRTAKRYKSQVIDILQKELKDYLPLIVLMYPHMFN
ncbi:MAG: RNA polymerase sigma-70 factor [Tannerella sp.]|jgi:RNA polymerase sigma-70 factor (ECF subfamily)|nr:RNA polymerase sigma-70 factor [Tannerella sp.]